MDALTRAQTELAVLQNENPRLKTSLNELDNLMEELRSENRGLREEKARMEGQLSR